MLQDNSPTCGCYSYGYAGEFIEYCVVHANAEKLFTSVSLTAELPTFHGNCNCRYCNAINIAKNTMADILKEQQGGDN
jgi:hypothetical protein